MMPVRAARREIKSPQKVDPNQLGFCCGNERGLDMLRSFTGISENPLADLTTVVRHIVVGDQAQVELFIDTPLMDGGLTSASAIKVRNIIAATFSTA